ncbi:MAG: hypothetical protein WA705_03930 [Candidatus Ozemobacteraceae bacterium]
MKSWLKLVVVLLVLGISPTFAFDGLAPEDRLFGLQNQVFQIIDQQWRVNDLLVQAQANPADVAALEAYEKAAGQLEKNDKDLGRVITKALAEKDNQTLDLVSSIFRTLDTGARQAIFPALQMARAESEMTLVAKKGFSEYFPGYGYPEPGFKYRRGRETSREYKGTTWQFEEHTIATSKSVRLTVTLDVLGILKSLFSLGKIGSLVVGREFQSSYNGTPMIVVEVAFSTSETIFTRTNRKYDVNKVWFELLRSSDAGWNNNNGTWEAVGNTYQIMMDPTGEAVTTQVELPGQNPTPAPTPAPAPILASN